MLLPSELFWIAISSKILNSSMKFKFIHKISVIQEKSPVFFNLFRGPVITRPGGRIRLVGSGLCIPVQVNQFSSEPSEYSFILRLLFVSAIIRRVWRHFVPRAQRCDYIS